MPNIHLAPRLALALLASCSLGACAKEGTPEGTAPSDDASAGIQADAVVPASKSVPAALDDADGLQTVAEALKETGIAGAFEGKGSYTLLAPEDDAFAQLGDAGKQITGAKDHAALAALLKDHILPGYVTPQDISRAIDASKEGQVSMPTISGTKLTFAKSGDKVIVSAPDGSQATLDGIPIAGGSSIAIPVSAVLKKV